MKLISKKCNIKYNGERYYANVPFDLNLKEIPKELENIVEEYVEKEKEEEKQFVSTRRKSSSTKKENKYPSQPKQRKSKAKKSEEDLLDEVLEIDGLE